MLKKIWTRVLRTTPRERLFCRLITAWLSFALLMLLRGDSFDELAFAQDVELLTAAWVIPLFFLVFTVASALINEKYHADSWFLFVLGSGVAWLWLVSYGGENTELFSLGVGVGYSLLLFYAFHANRELVEQFRLNKLAFCCLAVGIALISCTVIAVITCLRYKIFFAPNFDFGLFCNMFYNMKETGLPLVSCERDQLLSHFAVHISPVYYLFLPFFCLFPSPLTLQIGQAVVLALGVIPVVLLARHFEISRPVTALLAALYAFYPALSTGCFYDLHENCFLPLFLLLTFLFYEKKQYTRMYISALAVLSVKEDAAVYLAIFAIFLLISEKKYLHGGLLAGMAVGYFAVCAFLLETYGDGMMVNRFDNLIYAPDDGLVGAIKTALVNPGYLFTQLFTTPKNTWDKVLYACQMLLPLGLLPLCSRKPSRWLLAAPLLINLLTNYTYQYDIGFQYHFGILAFLVYASIKNLPELQAPQKSTMLTIAAAFCLCLYLPNVAPRLSSHISLWNNNRETYAEIEEYLDTVPEDASVSCSTFLLAHIADCDEIYEVKYHKDKTGVDYVVLDMRRKEEKQMYAYFKSAGYEVVNGREDLVLILKSPKLQ